MSLSSLPCAGPGNSPSKKAIESFYDEPHTARRILVEQDVKVPKEARAFVQSASEYARRS